jgi:hypothetical protein
LARLLEEFTKFEVRRMSDNVIQVVHACPSCQKTVLSVVPESTLDCTLCDWTHNFPCSDIENGRPIRCLVCGCEDLARQKDFPQRVGFMLVVLGAVLSTIAWGYMMPKTAIGILMGFALVDLLLYTWMQDVLVCYRCHARHRNASLEDDCPRFSLETAEKYRQEEARLRETDKQPVEQNR